MKKKIAIGLILIVLQLTKIWMIHDVGEAYGRSRIEYTFCSEGAVSYDQITRSEVYKDYLPVMLKRKIVSVSKLEKPAAMIGTVAGFNQLEHLIMLEGSFIINGAVEDRRNVAVISDLAAIKLYGSTKVVGKVTECNGSPYKIVGVYKKYAKPFERIIDDGYEGIYVPITVEELKEMPIKQVIINGQYIDKMPNQVELTKLGFSKETIRIDDYTHWLQMAKAISQYPLIAVSIIVCIISSKKLWHAGKNQRVWHQKSKVGEWQLVTKGIGLDLIFIGASLVLLYYSSSSLYIDPTKLPDENIFDLVFYWNQICDGWINDNLYRMESISKFGQLIQDIKNGLHGMNLIQYLLLAVLFSKKNKRQVKLENR